MFASDLCHIQFATFIDLYLDDQFPKSALLERKARLESTISELNNEHAEISVYLKTIVITDDQVEKFEKNFKKNAIRHR